MPPGLNLKVHLHNLQTVFDQPSFSFGAKVHLAGLQISDALLAC
jgi:hypothetical protein